MVASLLELTLAFAFLILGLTVILVLAGWLGDRINPRPAKPARDDH
jgi:hypothetical protein